MNGGMPFNNFGTPFGGMRPFMQQNFGGPGMRGGMGRGGMGRGGGFSGKNCAIYWENLSEQIQFRCTRHMAFFQSNKIFNLGNGEILFKTL